MLICHHTRREEKKINPTLHQGLTRPHPSTTAKASDVGNNNNKKKKQVRLWEGLKRVVLHSKCEASDSIWNFKQFLKFLKEKSGKCCVGSAGVCYSVLDAGV